MCGPKMKDEFEGKILLQNGLNLRFSEKMIAAVGKNIENDILCLVHIVNSICIYKKQLNEKLMMENSLVNMI